MAVRCEGDSWIMEQVGERQDFEAELSRLGIRHEEFCLHVRRGGLGGADRNWESHYAVRVTDLVTGTKNIYWGGPGENWVAQFVTDILKGMYRGLSIGRTVPLRARKSLQHPRGGVS